MKKKLNILFIILFLILGLILIWFNYFSPSNSNTVNIGYQTGVDPTKVAQAYGLYEKNSGRVIRWKKFNSGADVIAAMASGDIDIANIGTPPLVIGTSNNLPIEVFYITSIIGSSEALVVRKTIQNPENLIGKKIAVPFISTSHYSLLSALHHWNIASDKVTIINLSPPEIIAAWERGDIDGAYIWEPAISKLKLKGKVLISSEEVAQWKYPTYDIWVVRKDFSKNNLDFLKSFVKTSSQEIQNFLNNQLQYKNNQTYLLKISQLTGLDSETVKLVLSNNNYPSLKAQERIFKDNLPQDLIETAKFLKDNEQINNLKSNYDEYINILPILDVLKESQ